MAGGVKITPSASVKLDKRAADAIIKRMRASDKTYVTVGVHQDAGTYEALTPAGREPVPVSKVAFWLEYGTRFMPARPFLYSTIKGKQAVLAKLLAQAEQAVIAGQKTIAVALAKVGFEAQTFVQNTIKSNVGPVLSPRYLSDRMRRFPDAGSRTLIRTGLLLRSVRYKLFVDGREVGAPQSPEVVTEPQGTASSRAHARASMRADKAARAEQRRAAKADPEAAKRRFNAQHRVRPPRVIKPKPEA